MTGHKFTDEQIVHSLEICSSNGDCKECHINPHKGNYGFCTSLAIKAALDLINRQRAEIERLQHICDEVTQLTEKAQENCFQCGVKTNKAILNMQKAFSDQCLENERLKAEIAYWQDEAANAKKEAVGAFAERLKKYYASLGGKTAAAGVEYHVDQIASEVLAREEKEGE